MKIVTVSREFGSGGREIAKRLSEALGFAYYDREILTELAGRAALDEDFLQRVLEKGAQPAVPLHYARSFLYAPAPNKAAQLLALQHRIVRELAQRGDCVVVGRAADVVLRDHDPLRIFVYASLEAKLARCRARAGAGVSLTDAEITKQLRRIDRARAAGYEMAAPGRWGQKSGYDLCINTSRLNIEGLVPPLAEYATRWFEETRP